MKTKLLFLALVRITLITQAQNELTYSTNNGAVTVTGYVGSSGAVTNIVIPDTAGSYPVVSIGSIAFYSCYNLTNVTIGNNVTNIARSAFGDCTSLTNIVFLGDAPILVTRSFYGVPGPVYYYYGASGWGTTYDGVPTVMLGAPAPQISGNFSVQSNQFSFTVSGVPLQAVVVEASTNLVNWQPIWTNTLFGSSTNFTDPQWTNYPSRFYRACTPWSP